MKSLNFSMFKSVLGILLMLMSTIGIAQEVSAPFVLVLGIAQDGGYPHIGCQRVCCELSRQKKGGAFVTSLALIDPAQKKWWLFEATPNIAEQLEMVQAHTNHSLNYLPEGIFLSHAHIGHYSGLMFLGKEALGSKDIPIYVMPRMKKFLSDNGPWSQLVSLKNIQLYFREPGNKIFLSPTLSVTPFLVPHRDEYSETVGFKIETSIKKYLFIPDIDKWEKWNKDLRVEIGLVDVAFLDGSFYSGDELPNRDIKTIPHPLVTETIRLLEDPKQKNKVYFIHFNHTNPLLWNQESQKEFQESGFQISIQGAVY